MEMQLCGVVMTAVLLVSGHMVRGAGTDPGAVNGLVLWLVASAVPDATDGAAVSLWPDRSPGKRYPASNPTVDAQPVWQSQAVNGMPAVVFDGADDQLRLPRGFEDWTQGAVLFIVFQPAECQTCTLLQIAKRSVPRDLFQIATTNNPRELLCWSVIYGKFSDKSMIYSRPFLEPARPLVLAVAVGGGEWGDTVRQTLYVNGAVRVTGNNAYVLSPYVKNDNQLGARFRGAIAEVIMYGTALNDADRLGIEAYLAGKYKLETPAAAEGQ